MTIEWQQIPLGSACAKIGSGATPRGGKEAYRGGHTSLIRSQNIYNDRFTLEGLVYIDDAQAHELRNVVVEEGDVLLNITGDSVARCCQVDPKILPARVNQHVAIIRPRADLLDARFLRYVFVSPSMQEHLLALASAGATRNALTKGMIESLVINAPAVEQQRAIAHILGTLDDKIELNRKMNETLEAMAQVLFKSWFVDFDSVKKEDMCESKIGLIPKGWNMQRISKFMALSYGKALPEKNRHNGSVPVYGSGGVTGLHDQALITEKTIIVGRKGTVGSLYWESRPCFPIDTVFYVQPILPLSFCYYLLKSLPLRSMNTDAAVPGLNRENVYRLEFPLPPLELISLFSKNADRLRDRIDANFRQIENIVSLRDLLLPRLISGQLCIKDAEKFLESHI